MDWNNIIENVSHYVVKIYTPKGYGTGFLCMYSGNKVVCGIATALHVVKYAAEWQQPIKIEHYPSGTVHYFKAEDRVILTNPDTDSAVILISEGFHFPAEPIPLLSQDSVLYTGCEVGWVGYPNIEPDTLCFFGGKISAKKNSTYLIDGIAIHGVSGGPVLYVHEDKPQIVGIVSAYVYDVEGGSISHGLLYAQDVKYFHEVVHSAQNIKEVKEKNIDLRKFTLLENKNA